MFNISFDGRGTVLLSGRLDASQTATARQVFDQITDSATVDFVSLDYISSAGLGVLLATQQRLKKNGKTLTLVHMNPLIRDVFKIARFDLIFRIE
jgi:anti-sigma B factor antagonist